MVTTSDPLGDIIVPAIILIIVVVFVFIKMILPWAGPAWERGREWLATKKQNREESEGPKEIRYE